LETNAKGNAKTNAYLKINFTARRSSWNLTHIMTVKQRTAAGQNTHTPNVQNHAVVEGEREHVHAQILYQRTVAKNVSDRSPLKGTATLTFALPLHLVKRCVKRMVRIVKENVQIPAYIRTNTSAKDDHSFITQVVLRETAAGQITNIADVPNHVLVGHKSVLENVLIQFP